jgi:hypothetical protein
MCVKQCLVSRFDPNMKSAPDLGRSDLPRVWARHSSKRTLQAGYVEGCIHALGADGDGRSGAFGCWRDRHEGMAEVVRLALSI